MLKDSQNQASNIPNPSIKKGTIKEKLIIFLEKSLSKFQESFKGRVNDSEEELNEQLGKTNVLRSNFRSHNITLWKTTA